MGLIKIHAHDVNKAYFKISETDSTIEIRAEFPWTLREALISYQPELLNAKKSDAFRETFKKYIQENFILRDYLNRELPFQNFSDLPNSGHGHANNYLLKFELGTLRKIENRLMFNIYENQQNFHLFVKHPDVEIICSPMNPSVKLGFIFTKTHFLFILIPFAVLAILYLKFRKRKRVN